MALARRLLGAAVFVAVLVLGWRFAAENSELITVHYVWGEVGQVPLWAVVLSAFALGAALVAVLALYQYAKLGLLTRRYRKTVHGLEAEVHQLRNLPLSADGPADDALDLDAGAARGQAVERGA